MTNCRTPMLADKRFILCAGVILLVLLLVGLDRQPADSVLAFLGTTVAAYMAQSQWGQTRRATAKAAPDA